MTNPFGGLFDFNMDGKTDAFEMALGFQIMEEMDKASRDSAANHGPLSDDDEDEDDE